MTVYNTNEKAGCYDIQLMRRDIQSNLCHELRTPLIGILGFSELLMEGDTNCNVIEMATKINICGTRLLEFINILLTAPGDRHSGIENILKKETDYTEEEIGTIRNELLNRFKKLAAPGE